MLAWPRDNHNVAVEAAAAFDNTMGHVEAVASDYTMGHIEVVACHTQSAPRVARAASGTDDPPNTPPCRSADSVGPEEEGGTREEEGETGDDSEAAEA